MMPETFCVDTPNRTDTGGPCRGSGTCGGHSTDSYIWWEVDQVAQYCRGFKDCVPIGQKARFPAGASQSYQLPAIRPGLSALSPALPARLPVLHRLPSPSFFGVRFSTFFYIFSYIFWARARKRAWFARAPMLVPPPSPLVPPGGVYDM